MNENYENGWNQAGNGNADPAQSQADQQNMQAETGAQNGQNMQAETGVQNAQNMQTEAGTQNGQNTTSQAGQVNMQNTRQDGASDAQQSVYGSESLNQNHRVENVSGYTAGSQSGSYSSNVHQFHANTNQSQQNTQQSAYNAGQQNAQTGTAYQAYGASPTNPPEPEVKRRKHHQHSKEKKPGTGMTWKKTVAIAVIGGLVAAGSFKGLDIAYDRATGSGTAKQDKQTVKDVENASTVADGKVLAYDVSDVAANVMPSIVSITTKSVETIQTWFKQYQQEVEGSGSGIIIEQHNDSLYILTNYHVVQGANSLTVGFNDDTMVEATVKGYNADADLAVVEVDMTKMSKTTIDAIKIATLGDSDEVKVGQPAIAIGNALGYGQSLTGGYISATDRKLEDSPLALIQTDAAINPGNSGGALINANGEVIGINSSKLVDSKVEGMGFAIPINKAMELLRGIIDGTSGNVDSSTSGSDSVQNGQQGGDINDFFDEYFGDQGGSQGDNGNSTEQQIQQSNNKAFLGIVGTDVTQEYSSYLNIPEGVYITQITGGSPAETAGLQAGDVITSVDGTDYTEMKALSAYIGTKNPGDSISITFQRKTDNGSYDSKTVTATLAENTSNQ